MTRFQRWWLSHITAAAIGVAIGFVLLVFATRELSSLPAFESSNATGITWQGLLLAGILAGGLCGILTYAVAQKLLRLGIEAHGLPGWMVLGALAWPLVLAFGMAGLMLTWPVTFFIPDITILGWGTFEDGPLVAAFVVGSLSAGVLTGSALAFLRARARHAYVGLEE